MYEPFLLRALAGGIGLALIAAPLGCFVVWRRMAYFGETIAQAGLIGVALSFALRFDMTASIIVVTVLTACLLLMLGRQTLVPLDSILGLLAHTALAVGVVAAALVKGLQLDLNAFLFGDILSITALDLAWILGAGIAAGVTLALIWQPLLALSVHEDLAAAEGVAVERTKTVFVFTLAVVVAIAMKVVGALLTIAFLIMPAAAARSFANTPERMAAISAAIAALAVAIGIEGSRRFDTPAGASIVLVLAAVFVVSLMWRLLNRR